MTNMMLINPTGFHFLGQHTMNMELGVLLTEIDSSQLSSVVATEKKKHKKTKYIVKSAKSITI